MRMARFCKRNKELIFVILQFPHIMLQYIMCDKIKELYRINKDFSERKSFSLYNIPMFLDIDVCILRICSFQVRLESITTT